MGKNKAKQHQATKFEDHVDKITKRSILKTTSLKPIKKVQFAVSEGTQEKKNLFALDSDEEQQDLKQWKLTHRGKDLNDDYNDQIDDADSDEDLPKGFVKDNHFVGFDQKISKSKKDIYDDIIRNSKMKKSEKLKTKEENQERIEKLNEVLPVVLELLPLKKKNAPLDQSYLSLYQEFKMQPKTQVEVIERTGDLSQPSLAKQYRDKRKQQKNAGSDDEEFPNKRTDMQLSDSDDESQNDDMVNKVVKSTKEKKMLKSYKKVEHLNNMMDHLRKVQERRKNQQLGEGEEEEIDELDELDMSGDEDGEDEGEGEGEGGSDEEGEDDEGDNSDDDDDNSENDDDDDDDDDDDEDESVEVPVNNKVNAKQQNKKSRQY